MRWVDLMTIPADAPHAANAHAFINYLLKPEVSAGIVDYVSYASPNTAALPLVDPEIAGDPGVYPPAEVMAKLQIFQDLGKGLKQYDRVWTRVRTAN